MSSKQRVIDAVNHRRPERLPFTLYLATPLIEKLTGLWGDRENWPCPPDDLIRVLWDVETEEVSSDVFRDRFGCEWRREAGGYVFINPPLTEPNAKEIPRIDLVTDEDVNKVLEFRKKRPDAFIFYQFTACFGERLWNLRGMEQTMIDYLLEKKFVHQALDILLEMHFEAIEKLLTLPIDGITFGDDFGTQNNLMISKDVFLEFFKPRLAQLYEKVRNADKIVGHHSCGNNTAIMGDFIDIGLQVFHPLQPEAMDIKEIKKEFGKDLTFRGGIGTQGDLVFGPPEKAVAEVRHAVEILAEDGGYLLETAKPLPEETPVKNAIAIIEEINRLVNVNP